MHGFPSSIFWVSIICLCNLSLGVFELHFDLVLSFIDRENSKENVGVGIFLSTAAVLVPAPLIEFRYYTILFLDA